MSIPLELPPTEIDLSQGFPSESTVRAAEDNTAQAI